MICVEHSKGPRHQPKEIVKRTYSDGEIFDFTLDLKKLADRDDLCVERSDRFTISFLGKSGQTVLLKVTIAAQRGAPVNVVFY